MTRKICRTPHGVLRRTPDVHDASAGRIWQTSEALATISAFGEEKLRLYPYQEKNIFSGFFI